MLEGFDPNMIQDIEGARKAIVHLLNIIEELQQSMAALREENQRLRDEINRLKGEQGRPKIKPNKEGAQEAGSRNYSSEQERHKSKEHKRSSKRDRIEVNETKPLSVDRKLLPPDAEFKGYEDVVVQDIQIHTHNILFRKEKYYSASEEKTYLAEMPAGYEGEFGPGVKAWAVTLYYSCNMSEPKILEAFQNAGLIISEGQVSNFLVKNQEVFHQEKDAVYDAGLRSSPWQQIDETGTRQDGDNKHCHIVCNPLFTAYFTTSDKSRLSVLDVLTNFRERVYLLNAEAFGYLETFGLSAAVIEGLKGLPQEESLPEKTFLDVLAAKLPALGPNQRSRVLEAAAVAAYHAQTEFPVIRLLLCDDAKQFRVLTEELGLCWVHDGRHYKKMSPFVAHHRQLLETFRKQYWDYYERLLEYKEHPTEQEATTLEEDFDALFSTATGFNALDERIAKTKANKSSLLMVLRHPEIPLHNNPAELGARQLVRKRDVSFGTRTEDGRKAWDTFLTLAATAKKLGINFFRYVYDRVSGAYQMPHMAEVIAQRAQELRLGTSWAHGP